MRGLSSHWLFVSRTAPSMNEVYQPLEDVISQVYIPALTGCPPPSESLRLLFALLAHWGAWVSLSLQVAVLVNLPHPIIFLRPFVAVFMITH